MLKWFFMCLFATSTALADPVDVVMATAHTHFDRMPTLKRVEKTESYCGADRNVNPSVVYCTTSNTILITHRAAISPQAAYLVAHELGHAIQVKHGIADIALREIRNRRADERKLRGFVASQVDCVAGFLIARAGLPLASLMDWFTEEPFAATHWGRDPLRIGPQVQIGLAERDAWFRRGQSARTLEACAAGEFSAELLLQAYKE